MNDIIEKKIKEFLPYIIIIGVIYLFMPAILVLSKSTNVVAFQIMYMGVFPLAALGCGVHYGYKKTNDFFLSLVAPILFLPSMFIYIKLKDNALNCLIFFISYFICGYIGLTLGDMFKLKGTKEAQSTADKEPHRRKRVPKRVRTTEHTHRYKSDVFEDIRMPEKFEYENEVVDDLFSDTEDDIDAILNDIHNRIDF